MTVTQDGRLTGVSEPQPSPGQADAGRRRGGQRRLGLPALLATVVGLALMATALAASPPLPGAPVRVGPEVPLTAANQSVGPANNSPTIVADPGEPRFVVLANRLDAPDFSCALHLSGDGGHSWAPAQPVTKLPAGAEKCYAPEVAFDGQGTLYYLFVGLAGPGNEPMGAFITSSADRGRSFTEPHRVLGPLNFAVRMAIDPGIGRRGRLHLVWLQATSDPGLGSFGPPPNPVLAAHSDDGGRTFSDPVQVSDPDRDRVVAPAVALGDDHRVHVAYYDLERDAVDYHGLEGPVWADTWSIVLSTSGDGGTTFGRGVAVDDAVVPFERVMLIFTMAPPSLAVRGKHACVAWGDGRNGDADALVRCSDDRGRTWGSVQRMNDDKVGNGKSQLLPRLAIAPGGRVDAIFYDRRADPANAVNEVFTTYSNDGGRRFAPSRRVSSAGSSSWIGQQYVNVSAKGQVEFGNRIALWSRDDEVVAAWTDTRNSRPPMPSQDIFSAVLRYHRPRSGRTTQAGAGVLLVLVGAIGLLAAQRRRSGGTAIDAAAP